MCKPLNNFKFCTCSNTKNLYGSEYIWELSRYNGINDSGIIGTVLMPVENLGNQITIKSISTFLNSETKPFDFDYSPFENDSLDIRKGFGAYFKLIYKNGKWQEGSNPPFSSKLKTINKGILKK